MSDWSNPKAILGGSGLRPEPGNLMPVSVEYADPVPIVRQLRRQRPLNVDCDVRLLGVDERAAERVVHVHVDTRDLVLV